MSLVWIDGFENVSLFAKKYALSNAVNTVTATSRTNSGNCMQIPSGGNSAMRLLPTAHQHATLVVGFAWKYGTGTLVTSTASPLLRLLGDGGSVNHTQMAFTASGGSELEVTRSTNSTLGTTGGANLNPNTWYYIEAKITLHDSAGAVEVRINGATVLNLTGVDTKNAGTGSVFDAIQIFSGTSTLREMNVDDMYICTGAGAAYNNFLGDSRVETLRPDGNGNSSDFLGSDADSTNNYLLVDEATYDSADYVGASTSGNKDLYTFGDLVRTTGSVKGVMALPIMVKSDSGAKQAKSITRLSGTNYSGSAQTLTTTDVPYPEVWEVNPATSSDWTISEVNGAEFGVEVV